MKQLQREVNMREVKIAFILTLITVFITLYSRLTLEGVSGLTYYDNLISSQEINPLLSSPKTNRIITDLILKDEKMIHTELSGVVTILKDKNKEYLNFVKLETIPERLVNKILECNEDIECERDFFLSNPSEFEKYFGVNKEQYNRVYFRIKNKTDNFRETLKREINFYIDVSRLSSDISRKTFIKAFKRGKIRGRFIGQFHIHNDGTVPSDTDIETSKRLRQFVIAKKINGYDFFQIKDGKICTTTKVRHNHFP